MRIIVAQAMDHPKKPERRVPAGSKAIWDPMVLRRGSELFLMRSDGSQERTIVLNHIWEHETIDRSWLRARAQADDTDKPYRSSFAAVDR